MCGSIVKQSNKLENLNLNKLDFLAPTGAQEMLMLVCMFASNLSRAVNLHHSGSNLQAISQE